MTLTAVRSRIAGAVTRAGVVRSSGTLTSSYVAGTAIDATDFGMLVMLVRYTMGGGESANAVVLKVEVSTDGTTFYRLTDNEASVAAREYTFNALSSPGTYDAFAIAVPIAGVARVRVSAKETGVASNYGTCEIKYALGW